MDANVLFSFFKKHSVTRKLIFSYKLELYSPDYILLELKDISGEIINKSKIDIGTFELFKKVFSWFVTFVPFEDYAGNLNDAKLLIPDHVKDVEYFALCLKLNIPLWSNEVRLKKQDWVKVYNTSELIKLIES